MGWHGIIQLCDTPLPAPLWWSQVNMSDFWWGTGVGVQLKHYELVTSFRSSRKRISSMHASLVPECYFTARQSPEPACLDAKRWTITRLIRWARSHVDKSQHRQNCEGSLNAVVYAQWKPKSDPCMPNRHMSVCLPGSSWKQAHVCLN